MKEDKKEWQRQKEKIKKQHEKIIQNIYKKVKDKKKRNRNIAFIKKKTNQALKNIDKHIKEKSAIAKEIIPMAEGFQVIIEREDIINHSPMFTKSSRYIIIKVEDNTVFFAQQGEASIKYAKFNPIEEVLAIGNLDKNQQPILNESTFYLRMEGWQPPTTKKN